MKTTLVVDSSVIAKWFFPEENSEKALEIKEKFIINALLISVPALVYYEMNNIFRTAIKAFRVETKDALEAYKVFLKLNFAVYSSELLLEKTLEIALKFDISSYDASYLALAEYLHVPFLTADKKLLNKVSSSKFALPIQDYE